MYLFTNLSPVCEAFWQNYQSFKSMWLLQQCNRMSQKICLVEPCNLANMPGECGKMCCWKLSSILISELVSLLAVGHLLHLVVTARHVRTSLRKTGDKLFAYFRKKIAKFTENCTQYQYSEWNKVNEQGSHFECNLYCVIWGIYRFWHKNAAQVKICDYSKR